MRADTAAVGADAAMAAVMTAATVTFVKSLISLQVINRLLSLLVKFRPPKNKIEMIEVGRKLISVIFFPLRPQAFLADAGKKAQS